MEKRFENVVPQAPASFGYAVDRALHETEADEMNKRNFSVSLIWAIVALLVLAGAAVAVGDYFGITDFLSIDRRDGDGELPKLTTEYIGAKLSAGGYDFELTEYYYEGNRIIMTFTMDGYTDVMPTEVLGFTVDNCELAGMRGSGHGSGDEDASYFLEEIMLYDGGDTETVRIADIATGEELFAFEAVRSAEGTEAEGEVIILDAAMEGTGFTVTGYDVVRTTLTTELKLYIDIDPEAVELTGYETEDQEVFDRNGNVWHFSGCWISQETPGTVPTTAAEIMTGIYTPCSECTSGFAEVMGKRELFDVKQLHMGWVTDEYGEEIDFGYGLGYADPEEADPLKNVLTIDIDNTMLDRLPDVIYLRVRDFYYTWSFPDTAAIDVSALKAE